MIPMFTVINTESTRDMLHNRQEHYHNKVLEFVTLDNYIAKSRSFQLHWSPDHYKTALDGVSVILVAIRDSRTWSTPTNTPLVNTSIIHENDHISLHPPQTVSHKKRKFTVVIPYIKGVSEELRRLFKRYEVHMYFKPTNTLRQLLVRPKDKLTKERVVCPVYQISCKTYPATYIGETERSLKQCFLEHRRPSSVTSEVSCHIHLYHPDHSISIWMTQKLCRLNPNGLSMGSRKPYTIYQVCGPIFSMRGPGDQVLGSLIATNPCKMILMPSSAVL